MEDAELRNILFSIQGSIAGFQNDMSDVKNDIAELPYLMHVWMSFAIERRIRKLERKFLNWICV